jgi:hypothetical protein
MVDIWLLMLCEELCPKLTMVITEAIPIIMPNMVSSDLVLFRNKASQAIFIRLNRFIFVP